MGRGSCQRGAAVGGREVVRGTLPAGARGQHVAGRDRLFLPFRHHSDEAAVDHHGQHPAHAPGRVGRERGQSPAVSGRTQHAAVHHSRLAQIVHEGVAVAHQGGNARPRRIAARAR